MGKLVLIDGHAIMYRAFHAMPPLTAKNGEPISAVYGLVSMILRIIQDLKPVGIAVTFDETAPTFRNKALASYQAQRPPMPGDLSSQFDKAKAFLKAAGIPVYSMPGFEADDVIGTLATQATENSKFQEVIIVTGDRDQLQLVNDKLGIKLYMPVLGLSNSKMYDKAETIERMGVPPSQIADLKALTGDASDNYFGVPGIGPKTALNLLAKYKTIPEIYEHVNEVPVKVKDKLEKGKESAMQSLMLATIVRDVPINFDFEKMTRWQVNSPEVFRLFEDKFGFKTLTARIKQVGQAIEKEKQGSLF